MKTIFISLLLVVAGSLSTFATTPASANPPEYPSETNNIRRVIFNFRNELPSDYYATCHYTIPLGNFNYWEGSLPLTTYATVYHSPEELNMQFFIPNIRYENDVKYYVEVTSSKGSVEHTLYQGANQIAIRLAGYIAPEEHYIVNVRLSLY